MTRSLLPDAVCVGGWLSAVDDTFVCGAGVALDVLIYFLAISSFAMSKKRTRNHTCEQILICGRSDVEQKRTA